MEGFAERLTGRHDDNVGPIAPVVEQLLRAEVHHQQDHIGPPFPLA